MLLGAERREVVIETSAPYQGKVMVRFAEISDRSDAQRYLRADVVVRSADEGRPPEGEIWVRDLVGREIVDAAGVVLGHVVDVEDNPAHDLLLCADAEGRQFRIPMIEQFVDPIADAGPVVVRPIEGLLDH